MMKWQNIPPYSFVHARQDVKSIVGYMTLLMPLRIKVQKKDK